MDRNDGAETPLKRRGRISIGRSFGCAFRGIVYTLGSEPHMRFHLAAAVIVAAAGLLLRLSMQSWIAIVICIGAVMSLECVNTAVERAVDLTTGEEHPLAKAAKDCAAGAVLIAAVMAAVVGLAVFAARIVELAG